MVLSHSKGAMLMSFLRCDSFEELMDFHGIYIFFDGKIQ